ncbi:hypothetical protein [Pseudonocardia hydrocarbonoxydans]|nr:hypothetical protein [Pseudonocardia hydrocarbonoxydans]
MDIIWTLGVLSAGVENVQPLASGTAATEGGAIQAASDALVLAAMDRGRHEYRLTVAETLLGVIPGLTEEGEVDLLRLAEVLPRLTSHHR